MKKSLKWRAGLYVLRMEKFAEVRMSMLRVKNKKVVREIAGTTYRANKKRNFLTIFAIFLTTFLIAIVLALGVS